MTRNRGIISSNAMHSAPRHGTTNYAMRVFYALAIVFVVAGHSAIHYPSGFNFGYNLFPVYAFHMPMFIFASGYFYNRRHERRPLRFLLGKVRRLLLPMYAIHALVGVFVTFLTSQGHTSYAGAELTWETVLVNPWLHFNMHDFGFDLATWFVIPMFLAQCLYMALHMTIVHGEDGGRVRFVLDTILTVMVVAGGMAVMDAIGMGEANAQARTSDWLRLYQTACFMPFVALGYYYHSYLERHLDRLPDMLVLVGLAVIQLGLLWTYGSRLTIIICWVDFPAGAFGTMAMGMVGTLFWFRVSKILAPKLRDSWLTNEIGQNTFSIMAFHFFGFFVLNLIFYAILQASDGHFLTEFSVETFESGGVYYKCVPEGILNAGNEDAWGMLYVIFGVAVPLLLHRMWVLMCSPVKDAYGRFAEKVGLRRTKSNARDANGTRPPDIGHAIRHKPPNRDGGHGKEREPYRNPMRTPSPRMETPRADRRQAGTRRKPPTRRHQTDQGDTGRVAPKATEDRALTGAVPRDLRKRDAPTQGSPSATAVARGRKGREVPTLDDTLAWEDSHGHTKSLQKERSGVQLIGADRRRR